MVSKPIVYGTALGGVGFVMFILYQYWTKKNKLEKQLKTTDQSTKSKLEVTQPEEREIKPPIKKVSKFMRGPLRNLCVGEVSIEKQPILLYQLNCKHWIIIDTDLQVNLQCNDPDNRYEFMVEHIKDDTYRIFHLASKQWLFVSEDEKNVECHSNQNDERNIFRFEYLGNKRYFLCHVASGLYLTNQESSNENERQLLYCCALDRNDKALVFELHLLNPITIENIEFDLGRSKVPEKKKEIVNSQTMTNDSSETCVTVFDVEEEVQEKFSYQHISGVMLPTMHKFTTKLPAIVNSKIVILDEVHVFTYSHLLDSKKTKSSSFEVIEKPHSTSVCEIFVNKSVIIVPYKMTIKTAEGLCFYSHGRIYATVFDNMELHVLENT